MKKTLAIILTVAFVLSLGGTAIAATPTPMHDTIDGFDSYYVTGDIEVEALPLLYNVRDSEFLCSVRVKEFDVNVTGQEYDRNSLVVYYFDGDDAQEEDRVFSSAYASYYGLSDPDDGKMDAEFEFDFDTPDPEVEDNELIKQVLFEDTDNLRVNFALSAYISI